MTLTTLLVISFLLAIFVSRTLGNNLNCKDLDVGLCVYTVESSGKRCIVEKSMFSNEYTCSTSEIVAHKLNNLIETQECINACGVDKRALRISFDYLLDRTFVGKLCSNACFHNCPNIVDLYFNLAAGEGVYLPKLCEAQNSNVRREMMELPESSMSKESMYAPEPNSEKLSTTEVTQSLAGSSGRTHCCQNPSRRPTHSPARIAPKLPLGPSDWTPAYAPSP